MFAQVCRSSMRVVARSAGQTIARRNFAALQRVQQSLSKELQYEKDNYETPAAVTRVPSGWKFSDSPGNVNLILEKSLADSGKVVKVEWQLAPAYDGEEEDARARDPIEFTITIQNASGSTGLTYYCNTEQGEDHRFVIGSLKAWGSEAEANDPGAYSGPDFEDLDDSLQSAMDEYMSELGVSDEVYDFIDASASDKEHREYMRWLETVEKFLK